VMAAALGAGPGRHPGVWEAWAEEVRLELPEADAERLRHLREVRKRKAAREEERELERLEREYLGGDALADPGRAVVWWLARNPDRIDEAVDRIAALTRLSSAATGSEIPEVYRDLIREAGPAPRPGGTEAGQTPRTSGFAGRRWCARSRRTRTATGPRRSPTGSPESWTGSASTSWPSTSGRASGSPTPGPTRWTGRPRSPAPLRRRPPSRTRVQARRPTLLHRSPPGRRRARVPNPVPRPATSRPPPPRPGPGRRPVPTGRPPAPPGTGRPKPSDPISPRRSRIGGAESRSPVRFLGGSPPEKRWRDDWIPYPD